MTDTVLSLRRAWRELRSLEPDEVTGDWEAFFVVPLTLIAPPGLGAIGLPRWYGKRFREVEGQVCGVNLLRESTGGGLRETMPMAVDVLRSLIDATPTLTVTYAAGTRRPWPWVRDELRAREDGVLVGMTVVDGPGLRAVGGTPFLLHGR